MGHGALRARDPGLKVGSVAGRAAYATLFVVLLPLGLAAWSHRLDRVITLPVVGSEPLGALLVGGGLLLMAVAMRDLWVRGHGLPMSPFPPARLVASGSYRIVRDPIYAGAVAVVAGFAIWARSPAGLWIVTPVFALATAAWVHGFERSRTVARFGALPTPWLRLPPDTDDRVTWQDRISVLLLVFVPWLVLYLAVERLGAPRWAPLAYLPGERDWPVLPWTEAIYAATYPLVVLTPLVAPTRAALRRFAIGGLLASAAAVATYLLLPVLAPAKPVTGAGFWQELMRWERRGDSPVTALPAFHLVWAMLAGRVYARRWPRARLIVWMAVVAVGLSCITTGMHAMMDLVAAAALVALVEHRAVLWADVRHATERLANSWQEWEMGPVRILSHGAWAGLCAMVGLGVSLALVGMTHWVEMLLMMAVAILGAAVWAQVVEGSAQLLRPFGYFGGAFGAVGVAALLEVARGTGWLILAGFGAGAAFAQAIGRARCLVQGCCHGRVGAETIGIRYHHPRSRVVRLAGLGGQPLHPTPLYSFLWMMLVGAILVRLWFAPVGPAFVVGWYFILSGIGRFVEEHFRGEPQTATVAGLRLYQWLALGFLVVGAAATTVAGPAVPRPMTLPPAVIPVIVLAGLLTWAAYGVEVPGSNRRFSRLT